MKIRFKQSKKEFVIDENYRRWYDEKDFLKAVERNGYALRYVKEQTEAVCLKAVERNGYALQYVTVLLYPKRFEVGPGQKRADR